ncbi:Retrovirus-related Pol polyprotein from transposon TNT 1-94 [Exophiala dermatitidis]
MQGAKEPQATSIFGQSEAKEAKSRKTLITRDSAELYLTPEATPEPSSSLPFLSQTEANEGSPSPRGSGRAPSPRGSRRAPVQEDSAVSAARQTPPVLPDPEQGASGSAEPHAPNLSSLTSNAQDQPPVEASRAPIQERREETQQEAQINTPVPVEATREGSGQALTQAARQTPSVLHDPEQASGRASPRQAQGEREPAPRHADISADFDERNIVTTRRRPKPRKQARNILPLTWVFKYKFDNDGYLSKFKARICVRGDLQLSFKDTYAATLAFSAFRAIMAITAAQDLDLIQLDAINVFLNSNIDEEIYMRFPEGFKVPGIILRLLKALYGLKQSPLLWHNTLSDALKTLGLLPVPGVNCVLNNGFLTILFYVDDIIFCYKREFKEQVDTILQRLQERFALRVIPEVNWFLGIRIVRDRKLRKLWLVQDSYIDKLLAKFNVNSYGKKMPSTPLSTESLVPYNGQATPQEIYAYQQRIGSINFAATTTRPDVSRACSVLSQFLRNPSPEHIAAANRVLGYLKRTRTLALKYSAPSEENTTYQNDDKHVESVNTFEVYSDAAFADDPSRKSSDGYLFMLYGGPIDWKASRQDTVTGGGGVWVRLAVVMGFVELGGN